MRILGLNGYHGDSSAALLENGSLKFAVEEERFNRVKHWAGLPVKASLACASGNCIEHVAISRDPRARWGRKLLRVARDPRLVGMAFARARNAMSISSAPETLRSAGVPLAADVRYHTVEHHRAHLASAFFCSPYEEAAVISVDGFGDFSSVMWGIGRGSSIDVKGSVLFPHSLGLFYTAFTQLLGFPKYGDEYKMMGLSAYGEPRLVRQVRDVVHTEKDQIFLNLDYFAHHTGRVDMTWENCEPALGVVYSRKMVESFGSPRPKHVPLEPFHADLAASVQAVLEENYFALLNYVQKRTQQRAVCLAGGVALNCVANGMIFERTGFQDAYVQAAAHDAGTSIGAALYVQHQILQRPRSFVMRHVYFGPEYGDSEVLKELKAAGCSYHKLDEDELVKLTAAQIADGKIVGWFQGRMEFGPRALGNRSILADPRRADMKDILNARIKFREPFRPFCPSILAECAGEYFETDYPSPFMVMAYKIKAVKRDVIPAVVHKDGTGRLQTVEKHVNPLYWKLIRHFGDVTGVPVLLNTSFNENEPIVNTPAEAVDCFLRTRMDVLSIGHFFLLKSENMHLSENRTAFADVNF
jgi:carbamoyltransferase